MYQQTPSHNQHWYSYNCYWIMFDFFNHNLWLFFFNSFSAIVFSLFRRMIMKWYLVMGFIGPSSIMKYPFYWYHFFFQQQTYHISLQLFRRNRDRYSRLSYQDLRRHLLLHLLLYLSHHRGIPANRYRRRYFRRCSNLQSLLSKSPFSETDKKLGIYRCLLQIGLEVRISVWLFKISISD